MGRSFRLGMLLAVLVPACKNGEPTQQGGPPVLIVPFDISSSLPLPYGMQIGVGYRTQLGVPQSECPQGKPTERVPDGCRPLVDSFVGRFHAYTYLLFLMGYGSHRVPAVGFVPLPVLGAVEMRTDLFAFTRDLKTFTLVLDGETAIELGPSELLHAGVTTSVSRGPYSIQVGPVSGPTEYVERDQNGDVVLTRTAVAVLPLLVTLDAGHLPMGKHFLDTRWSTSTQSEPTRRLYFSPVLDSASVLWTSDSTLLIGTLNQGLLEIDVGSDLLGTQDDRVTPLSVQYVAKVQKGKEIQEMILTPSTFQLLYRTSRGHVLTSNEWGDSVSLDMRQGSAEPTAVAIDPRPIGSTRGFAEYQEILPGVVAAGGLWTGILFPETDIPRVVRVEDQESGLIDSDVSGICLDKKGYLWVSI